MHIYTKPTVELILCDGNDVVRTSGPSNPYEGQEVGGQWKQDWFNGEA